MQGKNRLDWLEQIRTRKGTGKNSGRTQEQSMLLSAAAMLMETHQRRLQIPARYIRVMRYLADNPTAVIVLDDNVSKAFAYAREALRYDEEHA